MTFFVKSFCETMKVTVVIFGMLIINDGFYCRIMNRPSAAYSSLCSSDFLSFRTGTFIITKFFVKGFCQTMQARIVIFIMQVDDDVLYRGIANQPSAAYSSLYLSSVLSFNTLNNEFFVKGFCGAPKAREIIFGFKLMMICCIVRLQKILLLILLCICLIFYTPALKQGGGGGGYWFTPVRPSLRPSVPPSVRPLHSFRQGFHHNHVS